MKNIMIVWMIFGSNLLSSFGSDMFFSYLRYRQTKTSSGNIVIVQLRLETPGRDTFFDPLPPLFGLDPYFGEPLG